MKKILIILPVILIGFIIFIILNKSDDSSMDYEAVKTQIEPTATHFINNIKKQDYIEAHGTFYKPVQRNTTPEDLKNLFEKNTNLSIGTKVSYYGYKVGIIDNQKELELDSEKIFIYMLQYDGNKDDYSIINLSFGQANKEWVLIRFDLEEMEKIY